MGEEEKWRLEGGAWGLAEGGERGRDYMIKGEESWWRKVET